ncbi:winged helix-turn-helix domain-containing protein [Streptomyces sp. NPDC002133]|uniref:ArsR/SmtB family transcription factor n=1 Tax=Streptomyces sp. NPDC002133 TaxID=3154409 RepID=UPI0033235BCE
MGWWRISADTLAGSRFALSPLAEATASLIALERGTAAHPGERLWLDTHLPAYRERLAAEPVTALLVRAGLGRRWIADFLTPAPTGDGEPAFDEELARIRDASAARVRADLEVSSGGPLPRPLQRPDLARQAAGLVEWVWSEAVLPYWPRRRRIIEADVVARTGQLSQGGWAAALAGMRQGMRWLGEGRLQVNTQDNPPREISAADLLFVPVTPRTGWVAWDLPHRYAVVYPCSGELAEPEAAPVPDGLGPLLGPARAAVLVLLGTPKSTTQLVALTGQGLGSVGRHLKVLYEAGLIRRRRAGRSVLYYRTAAGEVLVQAGAKP